MIQLPILQKLDSSIRQLEISIDVAREQLVQKHGEDDPLIARLDSYGPAIEKQRKWMRKMENAFHNNQAEEVIHMISLINSVSLMIKNDVKDALLEMQGIACSPDDNLIQ